MFANSLCSILKLRCMKWLGNLTFGIKFADVWPDHFYNRFYVTTHFESVFQIQLHNSISVI